MVDVPAGAVGPRVIRKRGSQAMKGRKVLALAAMGAAVAGPAVAGDGQPHPWQMGLQRAVTPVMEQLTEFHNLLLVIITLICLFVFGLIGYVVVRFREDKNPVPSKRSHNTTLEVIWTAVPVLILVIIAIPSFKLLYYMDTVPETEFRIKAIGRQWYWSYVYPDHGNFTFDAIMKQDDELEPGEPRLLATDNYVVIPVNTKITLQVTSGDVIHSWAVPAFGVKIDAIPGRLNEVWIEAKETGTFYGQCSELCGYGHGFMPIAVKVVSREEFDAWVKQAQEEFARADGEPVRLAAN